MKVKARLPLIILCGVLLGISCAPKEQAQDAGRPVKEHGKMSLAELERLYAAHEEDVERQSPHCYVFPDKERVARLAAQVPYHRRFFWQKAQEDFFPAHFVLRESPLLPAFHEEAKGLHPSAMTTEVVQEVWLRVLESDKTEDP